MAAKRTHGYSRIGDQAPQDASLSDFEKGNGKNNASFKNFHNYYQFSKSMPSMSGLLTKKSQYSGLPQTDDLYTDDEGVHPYFSADEFVDEDAHSRARSLKTGRQRKKLAARSKGSEFRANRKKRRVYFCCISSEIDVQRMLDELLESPEGLGKWKYHVYADVLHLYKDEQAASTNIAISNSNKVKFDDIPVRESSYDANYLKDEILKDRTYSATSEAEGYASYTEDHIEPSHGNTEPEFRISNPGAQEIFIFDFGAMVLWGVPRGEEAALLKLVRKYSSKGLVGPEEFSSGEDDMAFVVSPDATSIAVLNDVIELPLTTEPKQRLSVSFAIAQSSVLAIFEARIEKNVEEYKYIPEALAAHGKVHLSELQLGMMIGEVFVIRHDVNLHTEILGE